jgi:hypothetical protein
MRFFACSNSPRKCDITGLQSALCIITFVEALVFGLFVAIMMFDQLSAIVGENEDAQAHYEEELSKYNTAMRRGIADYMPLPTPPPPKSTYIALKEVFGGPFALSWFLPFNTPKGLDDLYDHDLNSCRLQAEKNLDIIVRHVQQSMRTKMTEMHRDNVSTGGASDDNAGAVTKEDTMSRETEDADAGADTSDEGDADDVAAVVAEEDQAAVVTKRGPGAGSGNDNGNGKNANGKGKGKGKGKSEGRKDK